MAIERGIKVVRSPFQVGYLIWKNDGPMAFYQGLFTTLAGIVPYKGTGFFMFHVLKDTLREKKPHLAQSKVFDFIFGATSGLAAQLGNFPIKRTWSL